MKASHLNRFPAAYRRRGHSLFACCRLALVCSLALVFLAGCGDADQAEGNGRDKPETFVFTAIPDQDEQHLRERFGKVAGYLEEALEVPVKYVPVKSYAAAVTAFANDQMQLAWFGGLSGVQARQRVPGSQAIAQGEEDKAFRSYFIANTSTGIERADELPEEIADKTFTFGSKGSTSGRLMPEFHVRQRFDQAPEAVFARVGFSGDHNRTIQLVQSGAYQIGAVNFQVWNQAMERGIIDTDKVQVIWETPPYPDYQWTIRGDVNDKWGDGFADKVREALLSMDDPAFLEAFPRSGFIAAENADYEPIRKTGEQIGLLDE